MYNAHPDKVLNEAFTNKPYQGASPETAKFIFVGLDANYHPEVHTNPIYTRLLEYLDDGVSFWKKYGVHHPFLLPEYRKGDGWKYHNTFSKIGFQANNANEVCFIELVNKPSFGRSSLVPGDLERIHLKRLNEAIIAGDSQHIFIPDGVARLMRNSSVFSWLPKAAHDDRTPLKIWRQLDNKTIYWHYHFSVYGAFEKRKQEQLSAMSKLVK